MTKHNLYLYLLIPICSLMPILLANPLILLIVFLVLVRTTLVVVTIEFNEHVPNSQRWRQGVGVALLACPLAAQGSDCPGMALAIIVDQPPHAR